VTRVSLLLLLIQACGSTHPAVLTPPTPPTPTSTSLQHSRVLPPLAQSAPPGCADASHLPVVDYTELKQLKGSERDLDSIPRGKRLPTAFRGTIVDVFHLALGYRSLTAEVCVGANGRVSCAEIRGPSGDDWFDYRVLRAIGLWEFVPYFKDSQQPIPVCSTFWLVSG
jgi:hypothetical protein